MIWALLVLNLSLASFALWAAITAKSTLKACTQLLAASSTRSLHQLDVEVTDLTSALSSITTTVRRLSSRIGMRDLRERIAENEKEPSDPSARKVWLRDQLRQGKLKVVRDNT